MKKKYFRIAALVLALVMMALAGCATPEPKPGGLELNLTPAQLAEITEKLYPTDIKREDTALWGDPMTLKESLSISMEDDDCCIGYVTVLDENWDGNKIEGRSSYLTFVKLRVDKAVMGIWEEGDEIIAAYYGWFISEVDTWFNVAQDMVPPQNGESFLILGGPNKLDNVKADYDLSFFFIGSREEIDGEEYLTYRDGEAVSVLESLRPLKEEEYTIKEVVIDEETKETRKIAFVKAEVMEQALVRVIENKEYEEWEDGYYDRVTEKIKPLTDWSAEE